jgi:hypothetical protein
MSYYHYTKGCHLANIVKDGFIKTTNAGCEKRERPAAWLTKSTVWESACNIGKILNHENLIPGKVYSSNEIQSVTVSDDYMKKEVGMCRILISETLPVISFAKFKYVSKISEFSYSALDSFSRSIGCPVDKWICTFNSIPKKYWEGIEMYVDDQWVRWDGLMPIQDFVNLCLSCNGKQVVEEELINGFPKEHCLAQIDFIKTHYNEIIQFWQANKDKKGYIEIFITPDYKPYPGGFRFIEKRVQKSTFRPFSVFEGESLALVRFLWEATFTQYRMGIAYSEEVLVDSCNPILD